MYAIPSIFKKSLTEREREGGGERKREREIGLTTLN